VRCGTITTTTARPEVLRAGGDFGEINSHGLVANGL